MPSTAPTVFVPLEEAPKEICDIIEALAGVAIFIRKQIARGPLETDLTASRGVNIAGEQQKALDIIADEAFADALKESPVRYIASEEQDEVVEVNPNGTYALAIDPLDGSSNIGVNVTIGTIFSIYPAKGSGNDSFLRPVGEQVAAGYFTYGPQTSLLMTFGEGCEQHIYDEDKGRFVALEARPRVPDRSREYAINASNYRHWPAPVRAYIDDCLAGQTGPLQSDRNMRWVASLVADSLRILLRGGLFIYTHDERKGYEKGRLRLLYECAPVALLIEQAGGLASDGETPIMSRSVESLHQRCPFLFGSKEEVQTLLNYFC